MVFETVVIGKMTSCLLYRLDRLSSAGARVVDEFYGSREIRSGKLINLLKMPIFEANNLYPSTSAWSRMVHCTLALP